VHLDEVRTLNGLEVDATLAHQGHDDCAAHEVVAIERDARTTASSPCRNAA
jgi:hypothetical protein